MKKLIVLFVLTVLIKTAFSQHESPYLFPLNYTNNWNAIVLQNDQIYFSIKTVFIDEGFSSRIVRVSKKLKGGSVYQLLTGSSFGSLKGFDSLIVGFGRVDDYKNVFNGQLSIINSSGQLNGPIVIGDTSNHASDVIKKDNSLYTVGYYNGKPIPPAECRSFGFITRYSIDGEKQWETYLRRDYNGFKFSIFCFGYITRKDNILAIGYSQSDSQAGNRQGRVITALLDTNGVLLDAMSEMDSFGLHYDLIYKRNLLPVLACNASVQVNDSLYAASYYDVRDQVSPFWVFFDEEGHVLKYRKAWISRDTTNVDSIFKMNNFKGLVRKRDGSGFYALAGLEDNWRIRLIELDEEMYLKRIFPLMPASLNNDNIHTKMHAFTEAEDHSFYTLHNIFVDSISTLENYGSMVCHLDSNGNLLSDGPLFPQGGVGIPTISDQELVQVYPNPTEGEFQIETGDGLPVQAVVYTLTGVEVYSATLTIRGKIPLEKKGVYLLRLTDKGGNSTITRVVVQ